MREATDTENYKIKLLSCFLYVPVAQLSSATFSEIERVLTAKSVAIHYRKIEIRNISLVAGKEEYNSENLFSNDLPCRIVICFIQSKNKTGDLNLNPFDFRRKWKYTVNSQQEQSHISEREKFLEQKLLDFEKQLAFFKSCVTLVAVDETQPQTSKGKGRGKKTTTQSEGDQPSFFTRLRSSFSDPTATQDNQSVYSDTEAPGTSSQTGSEPQPPPYSSLEATEKTVYIKQVDLLLNGASLDQIDTRETGNLPL
jgi:hypothetical protein